MPVKDTWIRWGRISKYLKSDSNANNTTNDSKIYAEYEFSAISMVALEWESKPDINAWRFCNSEYYQSISSLTPVP